MILKNVVLFLLFVVAFTLAIIYTRRASERPVRVRTVIDDAEYAMDLTTTTPSN